MLYSLYHICGIVYCWRDELSVVHDCPIMVIGCVVFASFLGRSHASDHRRSLAVSSTILSYICLCGHLGCVSEIQTSLDVSDLIKCHEELTSCSSLMHSYLFPIKKQFVCKKTGFQKHCYCFPCCGKP